MFASRAGACHIRRKELEYQDPRVAEDRINSALGLIVRSFNFLELNLGLCIRSLERPEDPNGLNAKLNRTSFSEKVDWLEGLLDEHLASAKERVRKQFSDWIRKADRARLIRNYYVHGTWEFLPLMKDTPLRFDRPFWVSQAAEQEMEERMNLDALEAMAQEVQLAFREFMDLRNTLGV